ncbi:MAG TPA: AMP-binding protein [Kofleriaceae bacterium]|jgi:feruloyl-CoA synthase
MLDLLPAHVRVSETTDGIVLESPTPLPAPAVSTSAWLERWARERPDATFLAERDAAGGWARTTYAEAFARVEGIAAMLHDRGGHRDRPVLILSENSVATALLILGAMHAGIPASPVSPAYSLQSQSHERLRAVAEQLVPGFVYADDGRYGHAFEAVRTTTLDVMPLGPADLASLDGAGGADLTPDTIAKVLFTSGSTGRPKGVVNTQRMLTANQESLAACWPFLAERPPVVVDWLPWSHTFGGNHNFHLVLRNGGALYIDRGRPAPGLVEITLANLADVQPTLWFNVPRGFDQAVPLLEADPELAARAFANLDLIFYAAAALGPVTRQRLEAVAAKAGRDIFFTSAWGSTETSPLATSAHFATATTGILGLPVPGVQLKLAPAQDRLELRVKGPNVTPGTWLPGGAIEPVQLDADGFLPTGDAGRLADPAHPEQGVVFAGRLGENFKLASGTWVAVAGVRIGLVEACGAIVQDAVIAGHDRAELGALLVLSAAGAALAEAEREAQLAAALDAYNAAHSGNSERCCYALALTDPLSLDEGETTDKGYTNQRRVLERRAAEVARLFEGARR